MVKKTIIGPTCVVVLLVLLISACGSGPSIVGRWRAAAPSSLLFEFSDDGTVVLLDNENSFSVFRYKIIAEDSLQLYDGMGRMRTYVFHISGDTMTFYDKLDTNVMVAKYKREK